MSATHSFPVPDGDLGDRLACAQAAAAGEGVILTGDTRAGSFSGKGIAGSYTVSGSAITFRIDKKPFYITESMIWERLEKMIG